MRQLNAARAGMILGLLLASVAATTTARGDFVAYSNITNFSGFGFANEGAANVSGDNITTLAADDITPIAAAAGQSVTAFTFSVANFNATAVSARPLVRFYDDDGELGGPGTFLAGFNFNPITFAGGSVVLLAFTPGAPLFTLPSGTFWAGVAFDDNNGTTGATLAQLNTLGQGIFNPPTIGSSDDVFFQTDAPGSFAANNPPGDFFDFGGNPAANFGWEFTVVPEPSSLALVGTGLLAGLGLFARRRAAGAAA